MRRSTCIALLAATLLFAGCGTSGGNDNASTDKDTTTSEAGSKTTDAEGGSKTSTTRGSTTTTKPKPNPKPTKGAVTSAQLAAILPTAADIGPGYSVKESDDGSEPTTTTTAADGSTDDAGDKAIKEACPEAAALDLASDEPNDDEVSIEFSTAKDQGIEVALDPTPDAPTKDQLAKVVAAFNACGTISYEEDGSKIEMTLAAKNLEGVGDYGAEIQLKATFNLFGAPLEIQFHGYLFIVDGVGVTVTSTSGLDEATFAPVPGEDQLLAPVAAEMEKRVRTLTD